MERIISLNKSWRFAVDNAAERKAASAKHQWKFRKVKAGQEDGFKSNGFDDSRWVDLRHGQDAHDPNKGGGIFVAIDGHAEFVVTVTDDNDDYDSTRPFYLYNIRGKR